MAELFSKINDETYKRIMDVEKEDVFKLTHLEQKKRDLEEKIKPHQRELDEINHIISEIIKIK